MTTLPEPPTSVGLLIVAHAPLASALRAGLLHVFPDVAPRVAAVDVVADENVALAQLRARRARESLASASCLVFTDVMGATPCNIACSVADSDQVAVVAGVNLPMLLRSANYLHEPLAALVERSLKGGVQCILRVPTDCHCPPQP